MTRPSISVLPANGSAPEAPDAPPGSLLARLRSQAAEQAKDRTVDVPIGGVFDPPLMATYGVLPVHELERYAELSGNTGNVELVLDLLARTNRELWTTEADGTRCELEDERGKVTYGHRLGVLLGMPRPEGTTLEPREVILMLFGGNGLALAQHGQAVITWMQNPGGQTPGESSAEAV